MEPEEPGNFWIGIAAVAGSVFFFGTMFVPVKRYKCGDGIFVQFIMGIAIFFVGFIVYASRGFPQFYPLPMLGGLFWGVANSTAIPLTDVLGLALALLLWNTTSCIMGWATSRFGLFGVHPAPPKSDVLNYAGLVLLVVGGVMFLFVRSQPGRRKAKVTIDRIEIFTTDVTAEDKAKTEGVERSNNAVMKIGNKHKRIIACLVCFIAGVLYGSITTPTLYMQDHHEEFANASKSGVDYVFSYFVGILLTTSSIFFIYAIIKRGHPVIYPRLVLPSIVCGASWAIAMTLLFVSNDNLSQTIAYPIITVLPGGVAALWSVFYFREIKGVRSVSTMIGAICATLAGSALIAVSKKVTL
uniref:Transmembrane protein 144 n=1 Tax=Ascaris suum TaxID=6253 RepID=F1L7T8_ASCSU